MLNYLYMQVHFDLWNPNYLDSQFQSRLAHGYFLWWFMDAQGRRTNHRKWISRQIRQKNELINENHSRTCETLKNPDML